MSKTATFDPADPAAFLRGLFDIAVAAADPMEIVPRALPPRPSGRVVVVGAGKASARMAEAVEQAWGPCEGLVITRYGHGRPTRGIEIVEAAHPVPDAAGAEATRRILDLVSALGPDDRVLALVSGGGSALLTAPAGRITLDEKRAINAALLSSGAPISQINLVRKHLSRVKGGQLAAMAHPAQMLSLLISDVPGDAPSEIASGPTVGEAREADTAREVLETWRIAMPDSVREVLAGATGVVRPRDPRLEKCDTRVIAAPAQSLAAAARVAEAAGVEVRLGSDTVEGEARDVARAMVAEARAAQAGADHPIVFLSGGECTVSGRGSGVGGPNAELALAAALLLEGQPGVHLLACDTDGVDGAAEVAGAIIGPDTLQRARAAGVDAAAALAQHDSHGFFAAVGGQIVTGPTLTNVNDFRAILVEPLR